MDLLLPRTDAGVAVQFAIFIAAALTVLLLLRHRREWMVLATGLILFGLGLFGIRAVH